MNFNIDKLNHTLTDVEDLLFNDGKIELGTEACERIKKCRDYLDRSEERRVGKECRL